MRQRILAGLLLCLAAAAGCERRPSQSLNGTWAVTIGHSDVIDLEVHVDADGNVSGTACATGGSVLIYKNVPLTQNGNRLSYTVRAEHTGPCCPTHAGMRKEIRIDDGDTLVLLPDPPPGRQFELPFRRLEQLPALCR